jgi:signal transduction histidine kinase
MAQENERQRISRDLHDQVGQTVIGLSLGLKALEREGGESPVRIHSLHALVAEISRDIHRVAADLRPSALDDLGLLRALQGLAANCAEVSGLMIDVQAVASDSRLSSEVETVIYRSVQEALTNVIKHADAHAVSVLLERSNDQLRVIIDDDGTGFDVDDQVHGTGAPHLGLSGMRERLTLVGGSMAIESVPGSGTTLFIQIPAISSQPALTS